MRGLKRIKPEFGLRFMPSHLLQMRGLKHKLPLIGSRRLESHLLQMRGLKLVKLISLISSIEVASFTDAWIETSGIES